MEEAGIKPLRNKIIEIDKEIVTLLLHRMDLAIAISHFKANNKESIEAKERVQFVLDNVKNEALKKNKDPQFIIEVYKTIIHELTQIQLKLKRVV